MKYDRNFSFWDICTMADCCAFDWAHIDNYSDVSEDELWESLCAVLTRSEQRSVMISTTDREVMLRDLIAACPYAKLVAETKSRHGDYNVQLWIFNQHRRFQYA